MDTLNRAGNTSGLRFWWPVVALAVVLTAGAGFIGLTWWIQAAARDVGARAMREFPGDDVEALLTLVQSEGHSLAEPNQAVYALGQIGDRRALPVLQTFYTGRECQHDAFLCQKELAKAIDRCRGRNWAPSWLPFFPRPPEAPPRR